jgi:hypothetical protein
MITRKAQVRSFPSDMGTKVLNLSEAVDSEYEFQILAVSQLFPSKKLGFGADGATASKSRANFRR